MLFIVQPVRAYDYAQMCANTPYPVSNKFSQLVSNATGMNFLLTQVVEAQIQKQLSKELNSKFKVKIKPYGAKNFIDGKFKSMELTSKKIIYGGLYISDFRAKTVCDFNHVVLKAKSKDILFPQNLLYNYSGIITSQDFQNTIMSKEYLNALTKLNVTIGNKVIFKIFDPTAKIEGGKIKLSYKVMTPFSFLTEVSTVNLSAGLAIKNEKIVFSEIDLGSPNSRLNLSKMLPLLNRINPLSYEFKVTKTNNATVKISEVKIVDSKILVNGVFIIPKNYAIKS